MITVVCDKCNHELIYKGILDSYYKYMHKFHELNKEHQTDEITDLCNKCFDEYNSLYLKEKSERRESIIRRAQRKFFGWTTNNQL